MSQEKVVAFEQKESEAIITMEIPFNAVPDFTSRCMNRAMVKSSLGYDVKSDVLRWNCQELRIVSMVDNRATVKMVFRP